MIDTRGRRLGAVTALVAGLFVGLTLLPFPITGPIGHALGQTLRHLLGAGALGIPLLGLGLALAGFDRLGALDMKRSAVLIVGLSVLLPYLAGVLAHVTVRDLDDQAVLGRLVGVVPGFFAVEIPRGIGPAGAVLVGFLALSALTLGTFAWHPLQRLEKGGKDGRTVGRYGGKAVGDSEEGTTVGVDEVVVPAFPPYRPTAVPPEEPAKARKEKEKKAKKPAHSAIAVADEESELPDIDLLTLPAETSDRNAGQAELDRLGQSLIETLRTFKVDARNSGRTTGPVVTQFEVVPAPGVKAGRIVALADDLAIAMRVPSVRVAPIPGKGAVGVEIPNPVARIVNLRELIEPVDWRHLRVGLPIALGHDLEGKPVVADLAKMPHLLIAGATGTGKSVTINTIITSLIYRYTPKELRLLMIDPKMVELSMYNTLPHLRHKVVTNNHDAATALKWAEFEMQRRYELLQANGARNVADFNRKVEEGKPLRHPPRPKPTLVTISAEPADTPPEPPAEETYSEGVLLITGLIKANFPSRIAFRVASKVDSRTILDQNGAEALLGNGDMLFLPPGKSEPMRLQGAYISTDESERVMGWYASRREARRAALAAEALEPDILEIVRSQEAEGEGGAADEHEGERDTLFREAAEACIQNQGGSTSLLQRRLRIGYGRAARIIDQLHYAGILGPPDGSKPREVLVGFDQLDEYCK